MCQNQVAAKNHLKPIAYQVEQIIRQTAQEYIFRITCSEEVKPGQFYEISLPKVGEAPISVSSITANYLEFTIRKVGKLTNYTFQLKAGDTIFMRGPYGNNFPLEKFKGGNLIVLAGGTGFCAVNSLLEYYYQNYNQLKSLYFLTGFRNQASILYQNHLAAYQAKFTQTIYCLDEEVKAGFKQGFVTDYLKELPLNKLQDYYLVIVGPQPMMDAALKECKQLNLALEKIWFSLERRMSCGIGKCGHCKIGDKYVCVDGPVFNYSAIKNLID
jgi:anaerobic sulfite reductase subunit B